MPWRRTSTLPAAYFASKCCVCHTGSESRDDWLDGDIDAEGSGAICVPCILEAASLVGMVTEEAANELLERALVAEAQLEEARAETDQARDLVNALRRFDATSPRAESPEAPAPAEATESGVTSSAPGSVEPSIDDRLAVIDAELDRGPVLEHACPCAEEQACTRRFASKANAGAHASRVHGYRSAK